MAVAEKDTLREHGCHLFALIRDYYACTGGGEVTLVESESEDHGFHLYSPLRATSRKLMQSIVWFINQPPAPELNGGLLWHALDGSKISRTSTLTTPELIILGVPSRPFRDIFGYGMDTEHHFSRSSSTTCLAYGGKAAASKKANYGLFTGPVRPNKAYKGPSAVAALPGGTQVIIKNFF